jgi:hypothetical protein
MNINWKYLTTGVLVATTIILSGYDIAAAMSSGEDATISQVILHAAQRVPALAFAAGFLCGHLFWPQKK